MRLPQVEFPITISGGLQAKPARSIPVGFKLTPHFDLTFSMSRIVPRALLAFKYQHPTVLS
jgi:hypothetical protein